MYPSLSIKAQLAKFVNIRNKRKSKKKSIPNHVTTEILLSKGSCKKKLYGSFSPKIVGKFFVVVKIRFRLF